MKLVTHKQEIEMLGDLVSPQPKFFLPNVAGKRTVTVHRQEAVVVERVEARGVIVDLATPVVGVELHNATHRLPICFYGLN
jgi:hypothetical protein